jgi:hypothetical protein
VHLNSCLMIGRVSPRGAQLRCAENGTPLCSFVLEIDEVGSGKTFTTFVPCEITGKYAEESSVTIEPGDVLQTERNVRYAAIMDRRFPFHGSVLAMTRHFSRFQGLSRAESGRKEPVSREVGNSYVHSNVNAGEVRELLAGYRSCSAVGPYYTDHSRRGAYARQRRARLSCL